MLSECLANSATIMNRRRFCAAVIATVFGARPLLAEPEAAAKANDAEKQVADLMSLMNQTAGGKQFWADVWFFHDWRIQCHALTGHYRLLDGANRRHASGTYEVCRDKMDEIRTRDKLPPMEGKAIIVLHGLFRTRSSMATLGKCVVEVGRLQDVLHGLSDDARQRRVACPLARQRDSQPGRNQRNQFRCPQPGQSGRAALAQRFRRRRTHAAEGPDVRPDGDARAAEPAAEAGDETRFAAGGQFRGRPGGRGAGNGMGKVGAEAGDAAFRIRRAGRRQRRWQGIQPAAPGRR